MTAKSDTTAHRYALQAVELEVPEPNNVPPPNGQWFRACDLVWHRIDRDKPDTWGFIVLLNSQNSPLTGTAHYDHLWLQRFTSDGKPYDVPLDLKAILPPDMKEQNWEGLAWF